MIVLANSLLYVNFSISMFLFLLSIFFWFMMYLAFEKRRKIRKIKEELPDNEHYVGTFSPESMPTVWATLAIMLTVLSVLAITVSIIG